LKVQDLHESEIALSLLTVGQNLHNYYKHHGACTNAKNCRNSAIFSPYKNHISIPTDYYGVEIAKIGPKTVLYSTTVRATLK